MADPISLSCFTAAIGGAIKLIEFGTALSDVSHENRMFLNLLRRVQDDAQHAICARSRMFHVLEAHHPDELRRLEGCIKDVQDALEETGKCTEGLRSDKTSDRTKGVTLEHRLKWVLGHNDKFRSRHLVLHTCHVSLTSSMAFVSSLEAAASPGVLAQSTALPPVNMCVTITDEEDEERRDHANLKRLRRGRSCISVSSVAREALAMPELDSNTLIQIPETSYPWGPPPPAYTAMQSDADPMARPTHGHYQPLGVAMGAPIAQPPVVPIQPVSVACMGYRVLEAAHYDSHSMSNAMSTDQWSSVARDSWLEPVTESYGPADSYWRPWSADTVIGAERNDNMPLYNSNGERDIRPRLPISGFGGPSLSVIRKGRQRML